MLYEDLYVNDNKLSLSWGWGNTYILVYLAPVYLYCHETLPFTVQTKKNLLIDCNVFMTLTVQIHWYKVN